MTTKTARPGGVRGQRALPRTAAAGSAHACHIGARNEPGTPSQSVVASTTADGGARIALHPVPSATPPQRQRGGPACLGEPKCMRARTQVAQRKHKKKKGLPLSNAGRAECHGGLPLASLGVVLRRWPACPQRQSAQPGRSITDHELLLDFDHIWKSSYLYRVLYSSCTRKAHCGTPRNGGDTSVTVVTSNLPM